MNRKAAVVGGLMLIGVSALAAYRRQDGGSAWVPDVIGDAVDEVGEMVMPSGIDLTNANLRAFLRMIRYAEGTAGENGYRMLFGGALFDSFADHPRVVVRKSGYSSTAAGAYQILAGTWDEYRAGLPDFSPASQDACAARLIRRRGALADVYAGRFADAVRKCAREWASLPGSPYGQPVRTLAQVQSAYLQAGGSLGAGSVYA